MTKPTYNPVSFDDALITGLKLMAQLYQLRYRYPPSHEVWHHIPRAQTTLNRVIEDIGLAKKSTEG